MNTPTPSVPSSDTLEGILARVADEFTDRVNRGESPDVEEYLRRHPEHADRLRSVLMALQSMRGTPSRGSFPERVGEFRLLREIGRGGMGVVYEAVQEPLGRRVALKVLPGHFVQDPRRAERFRREARAAGQLHHTNIVPVFGAGEADGVAYYAMQLIAGRDPRSAGREPTAVARIGLQAAEALHHAHQHGVLHRDVKPSNLLLDAQGTVWVTDFGLAKVGDAGDLTDSGQVVGTLRYLAPEQFAGRAERRSDVYSLGLTLFELATGRPAFDAEDYQRLVHQILHEEPPRPRLVNPLVPRDLETILLKATAREPAQRYATAEALAADLRRFLAGEPPLARRVGPLGRVARWARRHPLAAGLVGLAALLLVAVAVTGLTGYLTTSAALADSQHQRGKADTARADEARMRGLAEYRLYAVSIQQSQEALESGEIPRLRELLDAQKPTSGASDFRGWEWHWLRSRLARLPVESFRAGKRGISDLDAAPDGRLAVASDGMIHIRSLEGRDLPPWRADAAYRVAWRPDGARIASVKKDGGACIWDPTTGKEVWTKAPVKALRCLAWSPDGRLLALGGREAVHVWDADNDREVDILRHPFNHVVVALAWSPDGTGLATASAATVRVWDTATWQERKQIAAPEPGDAIQALGWSPDCKHLAAGGLLAKVHVIDAATGEPTIQLHGHAVAVWSLAWSANGRLATGGIDGTVYVWDVRSGRSLIQLRAHPEGPVGALAWLNGERLATGAAGPEVRVWDVSAEREHRVMGRHTLPVVRLAWDATGERLLSLDSGYNLKRWDGGRAEPAWSWKLKGLFLVAPLAEALAWHPATGRVAVAGGDKVVHLLSDQDGRELSTLHGHAESVYDVAFSPNGARLASASYDQTCKVWDVATGRELFTLAGEKAAVNAVAWSPDRTRLATGGGGKTVHLWMSDGTAIRVLKDHTGGVQSVAFSPDGSRLASASGDRTVRVWDVETGEVKQVLRGHGYKVDAVAWSPDGRRLGSASGDRTVKVWDVELGVELLTLRDFPTEVRALAWSPNGRTLAAGMRDGTVRVWEAERFPADE